MIMAVLFVSISFLGSALQSKQEYQDLSVNALKEDNTTPVISTEPTGEPIASIQKPYKSEKVSISKSYYNMQDDEKKQQQSLIYYENTYLQNTGVLYTADEEFEINAVLDGTVTNVSKDEILGNMIEITHNTNLKSIYYSLSEINVKKDDAVLAGTVIGKSGDNNLTSEKNNCLLFEVYYNGSTINPEDFYNMDTKDLQ